jgi:hypothetical protein
MSVSHPPRLCQRPAGTFLDPYAIVCKGEAEYQLAIRAEWEVPGAAILDALTAQPGIDAGRIGVWGVSLGGYYAPRLASGDPRVRACAAWRPPPPAGARAVLSGRKRRRGTCRTAMTWCSLTSVAGSRW